MSLTEDLITLEVTKSDFVGILNYLGCENRIEDVDLWIEGEIKTPSAIFAITKLLGWMPRFQFYQLLELVRAKAKGEEME